MLVAIRASQGPVTPTSPSVCVRRHYLGVALMKKKVTAANVKLKQVYERRATADGIRILIGQLWPNAVKKADADIDQWVKDIAPSISHYRSYRDGRG
jgi:hypothetical protein